MLKAKHMLLVFFIIKRFNHFHDSVNIVVISYGCAFSSAKCAQFPLTFVE